MSKKKRFYGCGNTGEVFDDAQGYGYKDYKSALRAFNYKKQSKEKIDTKYDKEEKIAKWKSKNKRFVRLVEDYMFYEWKDNSIMTLEQFEELYTTEIGKFTEKDFALKDLYKTFIK